MHKPRRDRAKPGVAKDASKLEKHRLRFCPPSRHTRLSLSAILTTRRIFKNPYHAERWPIVVSDTVRVSSTGPQAHRPIGPMSCMIRAGDLRLLRHSTARPAADIEALRSGMLSTRSRRLNTLSPDVSSSLTVSASYRVRLEFGTAPCSSYARKIGQRFQQGRRVGKQEKFKSMSDPRPSGGPW